jgi:hypothetical protein
LVFRELRLPERQALSEKRIVGFPAVSAEEEIWQVFRTEV